MKPSNRRAFTLVELLVVITIVAILLALLSPAMDRAVYQAELAMCAAKLDAVGGLMTSGALERKRQYPARLPVWSSTTLNLPKQPNPNTPGGFDGGDNRPALREYLGPSLNKMLNDPLVKPVDIDGAKVTSLTGCSYNLWYRFPTGPSQQVMRKLGDRWSWAGRQFNILASDHEMRQAFPYHTSSHPDRSNIMYNYFNQDGGGIAVEGSDTPVAQGETASGWFVASDTFGLLDFNVLYQDGAALRYADIKNHGPVIDVDADERMTTVPWSWNSNKTNGVWFRVPKQ